MASLGQVEQNLITAQNSAKTGYPQGGLRFDWVMVGLSALFIGGLWVDGWAHFHNKVDDSFFTPWHFVFYGAFGILALFLGGHQVRNVTQGYRFSKALPQGYQISLLGVALFAVSGFGDMIWHTLFGIEGGTEALMSPSHIGLAIGMFSVFAGPVLSIWTRAKGQPDMRGWRALGPMILGVSLIATLAFFFTSYTNPIVNPIPMMGRRGSDLQDYGVTNILFAAAILSVVILPMLRRWRLPFGTFTLMFGLSTALLTVLNDFYLLIPGALIAGLLVDIAVNRLRPSQGGWRLLAVSFIAPFTYFGLFLATLALIGEFHWSIHVWSGSMFISGVVGASLALLTIISASETPSAATEE